MLFWWLMIWLWDMVAMQQVAKINHVHIPDVNNCLFDCSGKYRCREIPKCNSLQYHYNMKDGQHSDVRELLVYGHNGLRNRLGLVLDICDMLSMTWDDELAELSNRHHMNCEKFIICKENRQKTFVDLNQELKQQQKVFVGNTSHLARNSNFDKNIYSTNFIESAVGNWYLEHRNLEFPKTTSYFGDNFYKLIGENSFTHIINPQTHRVGCSFARFRSGLSLICYYFPYIRNNTVFLRAKPSEYQCPYNFPILDPVFKRLCGYAVYS